MGLFVCFVIFPFIVLLPRVTICQNLFCLTHYLLYREYHIILITLMVNY